MTMAYCLLGTFKATTGERTLHAVGLIGGLLLSVAMGIIRLVGVGTDSGLLMAMGLMLLEVAIVVLMEFYGRGLRRRYEEYSVKNAEFNRRYRVLDAAEKQLGYWQNKLNQLQAVIQDFVLHVYDREARNQQVVNLIAGNRQAVTDGFMQGLSENQARILGHHN